MTDDELKELVASLAIDQKELTKKMAQTDEQIAQLRELQKVLTHHSLLSAWQNQGKDS